MKRERGFFRGSCLAAKMRLSTGYSSKEMIQQKFNYNKDDEQFYQKVCMLLNTTPNCNPLAGVLDREYMLTLHGAERERYVFTLSKQVQHCIQRFEQEKEFEQTRIAR